MTVDLAAARIGNPDPVFPQIGTPITLPGCALGSCPQVFYTLAITPDGATVFRYGSNLFRRSTNISVSQNELKRERFQILGDTRTST